MRYAAGSNSSGYPAGPVPGYSGKSNTNQLVGRDGIQELLEEFRETEYGQFQGISAASGEVRSCLQDGAFLAVTEAWMQRECGSRRKK